MANLGNAPLTVSDFVMVMNAILIEVYADIDRKAADDRLTDLATRLDGMARKIDNPIRAAVIGGLSAALMHTEDGG